MIMKKKKNDSTNIEQHKRSFFLLGMVISISLSLIAFEWNSSGPDYSSIKKASGDVQTETDIINTFRKEKEKPKPPPPAPP
jgi:protein TonB